MTMQLRKQKILKNPWFHCVLKNEKLPLYYIALE